MTPKEIVERVRQAALFGCNCPVCSSPTARRSLLRSDISHLLAIHAAVVEMFEARQGYLSDDGVVTVSGDQLTAAFANLAALCGWKAEEP